MCRKLEEALFVLRGSDLYLRPEGSRVYWEFRVYEWSEAIWLPFFSTLVRERLLFLACNFPADSEDFVECVAMSEGE